MRIILCVVFLSACGSAKLAGQACGVTADCQKGLFCSTEKICADPRNPNAQASGLTVSPSTTGVFAGATTTFTASQAATWSLTEANGGHLTSAGVYTAPAISGTYHAIATSTADASKKATVTISVYQPLSVSPATAAMAVMTSTSFTAGDAPVTWTVDAASGASVDGSGHLSAGATAGIFHVTASALGTQAQATVTISPTLSSFSTGESARAETVTISGVGFGASQGASTLELGGIEAIVLNWGASAVTVRLPADMISSEIVATVAGVNSNALSLDQLSAVTPVTPFGIDVAQSMQAVSDGHGGSFVVELTSPTVAKFKHLGRGGALDSATATLTIQPGAPAIGAFALASDGNGGAVFAYAFLVASSGGIAFCTLSPSLTLSPAIPATVIATIGVNPGQPYLTGDGSSGAFVVMSTGPETIFQHVSATGSVVSSAGHSISATTIIGVFSGVDGKAIAIARGGSNVLSSFIVASDGTPGPAVAVASPASLHASGTVTAASDNAGGAYVAWLDAASPPVGHVQRANANGAPVFAQPANIALVNSVSGQTASAISGIDATLAGDLVTMWSLSDGMYWSNLARKVSGADGSVSWSGKVYQTDSGTLPVIAASSRGGMSVAYWNAGQGRVQAWTVGADGTVLEPNAVLVAPAASGAADLTAIADDNGGLLAVWLDGSPTGVTMAQGVSAVGTL